MEVAYKTTFEDQMRRFAFRFTCDHCVHFDDRTGDCLHGFPNQMHKLAYYQATPKPKTILFCKDFDLA